MSLDDAHQDVHLDPAAAVVVLGCGWGLCRQPGEVLVETWGGEQLLACDLHVGPAMTWPAGLGMTQPLPLRGRQGLQR